MVGFYIWGHLTAAQVNKCPVVVQQAHRAPGQQYGPRPVTVSTSVDLSLEDVVARSSTGTP